MIDEKTLRILHDTTDLGLEEIIKAQIPVLVLFTRQDDNRPFKQALEIARAVLDEFERRDATFEAARTILDEEPPRGA